MKFSQFQINAIGIALAVIVAFVSGTQFRSGPRELDRLRAEKWIESAEFDKATVMSLSGKNWQDQLTESNRFGRVIGMYTEGHDGSHRKLIREESPDGGTVVIVPGWINGQRIRIVVAIGQEGEQ